MKRFCYIFIILIFIFLKTNAQNTIPEVVSGKIVQLEHFQSKYISTKNIDIWLPDNYSDSTKYAVLYMQDGQMLFDAEKTWNKQAWNIDGVASKLIKQNKVKNFIVVGIWNDPVKRHAEYFPQKPFENLSQVEKDTVTAQLAKNGRVSDAFNPYSDNYLKFIVKELKPYIDKHFSVYEKRKNTFIGGSSMGGLISIYAICEYPEVFGGAICMSTHWPGTFTLENNPIPDALLKYLNKKLPNPNSHKIYFDYGGQTLDTLYPAIQKKVDLTMKKKGYSENNWMTKYFPNADHSENSWNKRLNIPLEFILKK